MNIDNVPFNLKTDREVFEHVRDHLIKQNQQSMTENGFCVYRGPNGTSCAIGCLISEEFYDQDEMEDMPANSSYVMDGIRLSNPEWVMSNQNTEMLMILQRMHDALTPYTWEEDFAYIEEELFADGSDSVRENFLSENYSISQVGLTKYRY